MLQGPLIGDADRGWDSETQIGTKIGTIGHLGREVSLNPRWHPGLQHSKDSVRSFGDRLYRSPKCSGDGASARPPSCSSDSDSSNIWIRSRFPASIFCFYAAASRF